jgi:hypothetical protein
MSMQIPIEVARRFILGKQGLWPGRRWRGLEGAERAMRAIEHRQLDPLVVIASAHDLILHSRVVEYRQGDWATLTYDQRRFFDWGGCLAVRPTGRLWLEDDALAKDPAFGEAISHGMGRFMRFLDATRLDARAVAWRNLGKRLTALGSRRA